MDSTNYIHNYCFPEGVPLSFRCPTHEERLQELCRRRRKSFLFVIATMYCRGTRVRESTQEEVTTYNCCHCKRSWTNLDAFPEERVPRLVEHARDFHSGPYHTRMETKMTTVSLSWGMLSDLKTYLVIETVFHS